MNVGKLNKRIKVYAFTKTSDGYGGYTEAYSYDSDYWAKIIYANSSVQSNFEDRQNIQDVDIIVRKNSISGLNYETLISIDGGTTKSRISSIVEYDLDNYIKITIQREL